MALWQIDLDIIPKEKINKNTDINEIDFDDIWNGYTIKECSINQVEQVLKRKKSWSENIVQLGNIDETVIEIMYDADKIIEVSCRMDLRNITKQIMKTIFDFIDTNSLAVIVNDKIYTNLNKEIVKEIVNESAAYKFLKNPEKFLSEL